MTADDGRGTGGEREPEALDPALATALREERPEIRPQFARQLDARVAAGFPRRRRRFGALRDLLTTSALVPSAVTAALLAVVVTAAVLSAGDGGRESADGGGGGSAAPAPALQEDAAGGESADEASGAAASPGLAGSTRSGRPLLALAVPAGDLDAATVRVGEVAERYGGAVASSSGSGNRRVLRLRIPAGRVAEALAELERVGTVRARRAAGPDLPRAERRRAVVVVRLVGDGGP